MNKEWSEQNKRMQSLLKKATFSDAVAELTALRDMLMSEMLSWRGTLSDGDYSLQPFANADGYHSKTVAYSIWHIMRIEDITVNRLILGNADILERGGFAEKTRSTIVTTGNELVKEEIAEFSKKLDIGALYEYAITVKDSTDKWLRSAVYDEMKRRFDENDRARLRASGTVSADENAAWLIDYWCGKDVAGLIKMPLSRHWIMHVEAAGRIIEKIKG